MTRRPERCPERGLKERRSYLDWNGDIASGEPSKRKLGGWDEIVVGWTGENAPVSVCQSFMQQMYADLICRTAVYVTRTHGGVGGGSREASPYPDYAANHHL
jgi:hypothetical protein